MGMVRVSVQIRTKDSIYEYCIDVEEPLVHEVWVGRW